MQTTGCEARLLLFVCTLVRLHCSDVVVCATDCGNRAGCADLKQEAPTQKADMGSRARARGPRKSSPKRAARKPAGNANATKHRK